MSTLHEAADAAMALASKLFEENGHLDPLWLITTPEALAVVHGRFDGPESKDLTLAAIRDKFGDSAIRIIFMCESWFRTIKKGEVYDGVPPSKSPDKMELIHLMAEDKTGGQVVLSRKIERSEDGKSVLLPIEVHNASFVSGRFASFFAVPTGVQH